MWPGGWTGRSKLFETGYVALVRRGHPLVGMDEPSLAALEAAPHLDLSSTGEGTECVDAELARHGLARRVALHAPLLAAAAVLAQSDTLAVVGERTAQAFAGIAPLAVLPLPFASPRLVTAMLWHRCLDDVPAHRWLRTLVLRVARLSQARPAPRRVVCRAVMCRCLRRIGPAEPQGPGVIQR